MNPSNYDLGTVATYSCSPGFVLDISVGTQTRECEDDGDEDADGVFNNQPPTCVRKFNKSYLSNNIYLSYCILYSWYILIISNFAVYILYIAIRLTVYVLIIIILTLQS